MVYHERSETKLLQLFAHPKTSEWFSTNSAIIFELRLFLKQKNNNFLFFTHLNCPQLFFCLYCPAAAPYLSILFGYFPLISPPGISHVTISLIGCTPRAYVPGIEECEDYWHLKYVKTSTDQKTKFEKSNPCSMC